MRFLPILFSGLSGAGVVCAQSPRLARDWPSLGSPPSPSASLLSDFAVCLCLMTIFWALYLLAYRKSGRDRALLGLMGMLAIYQGSRLLRDLGLWQVSLDTRVDELATLSVSALGLLAVYMIGRWGTEHRVTAMQLRVIEEPLACSTGRIASPELLEAVLQVLPLPLCVTGKQGEVLFSNRASHASASAAPTPIEVPWSAPVGPAIAGWQVHLGSLAASSTASRPTVSLSSQRSSVSDVLPDRRRHLRLPVSMLAEVEDLAGAAGTVNGEIIDYSGVGLALLVPVSFARSATLAIRAGENLLLGEVKTCQESYPGYRVGVDLKHVLASGSPTEVLQETQRQATGQ